ncbi:HNH endonuclease signature motif containing protein [Mollicutes bacterium LVI A0039]|nr:HNH endonuclease signature motif containing protein [Mollicutes bacterium LVI A0039]
MQYEIISKQIFNMKCNKIYKPVLILAYLDYIEVSIKTDIPFDLMADLNYLIPFVRYYLSFDEVVASGKGTNLDISDRQLYRILVDGPLERIETECSIFTSSHKDGIRYFGINTTNESIDLIKLITTVRKSCKELIASHIDFNMPQLPLDIYISVATEIRKTRIDLKGHPKIYKYILILSLLDYFVDIKTPHSSYNIDVPVDLLLIYYKLYLNDDMLSQVIQNKKIKEGSDNTIKRHIMENPLRRLCNKSTHFKCNTKDFDSRTLNNMPNVFQIAVNDPFEPLIMNQVIRSCCYNLISKYLPNFDHTIVYDIIAINESQGNEESTVGRRGQAQYRKSLLDRYSCSCAICNLDFDKILVASHAKPWSKCYSVHERLSPNNGLLLCENHDALFDKGYITFDIDNNFEVIFAEDLNESVIDTFNILYDNKISKYVNENPQMKKYLEYHSKHIFKHSNT